MEKEIEYCYGLGCSFYPRSYIKSLCSQWGSVRKDKALESGEAWWEVLDSVGHTCGNGCGLSETPWLPVKTGSPTAVRAPVMIHTRYSPETKSRGPPSVGLETPELFPN